MMDCEEVAAIWVDVDPAWQRDAFFDVFGAFVEVFDKGGDVDASLAELGAKRRTSSS